jgi:hypothetical protein
VTPYQLADADQVLDDFGEDLVCAAAPGVTRGLIDQHMIEHRFQDGTTVSGVTVLKVKRGAFGSTNMVDTRVTVNGQAFNIDSPISHESSLFDWYALQALRVRQSP